MRAQQGYLVTFPSELIDIIPHTEAVRVKLAVDARTEVVEDTIQPKRRVPRGRPTRVQDPQLRTAIETHAVDAAIDHYSAQGATDIVKLGTPYNIRLRLNGAERHVEVKGSSLMIETVELTINEVNHARDFQPTDLVVIDGIEWARFDGEIVTTGGRLRTWPDWSPDERDLAPRNFAYSLPAD